MILTEHLVKLLEEINLEKSTYSEAYVELGQKLSERVSNSDLQQEVKDYFRQLEVNMEIWVDACGKVLQ